MMLFGEKYPDPVRMVSMGDFSKELCGGTHLENTTDVGTLEIISEEGVSAGTRRILAFTGEKAREHVQQLKTTLESAAELLGTDLPAVPVAVRSLSTRIRDLKKQLSGSGKAAVVQEVPQVTGREEMTRVEKKSALQETARILNVAIFDVVQRIESLQKEVSKLEQQQAEQEKLGPISVEDLLAEANEIGDVRVIVAETRGANPNVMRQLIDQLRKKFSPVAVLLGASQGEDKVTLVAGLSRELVEQGHSAGDWVRATAQLVGGGGGGKPDMAQAGGKHPEKLAVALNAARKQMTEQLG